MLFVTASNGATVLTSYHGYAHTAVGEAVLRDGLQPENPYHAGEPLRYYTAYPLLGVALGHLGCGPLWGFALLNLGAALLFALALDALGRGLGLGFRARRFAFLLAVLGFNGLGWLGGLLHEDPMTPNAPVFALRHLTLQAGDFALAWDARLQAFLPKFLNVSSFAPALALGLAAIAAALRPPRRSPREALPAGLLLGLLLGLTMALNPLVGAWTALVLLLRFLPLAGAGLQAVKPLLPAVLLSVVVAVPFLLPLLSAGPAGEGALTGTFPLRGSSRLMNLLGPLLLLLPLGVYGLRGLAPGARPLFLGAAGAAAVCVFLDLPWANEYKFSRLSGVLWALPAGAGAARLAGSGAAGRLLAVLLLIACAPTLVQTTRAYLRWDNTTVLPLQGHDGGRLTAIEPPPGAPAPMPPELLAAEAALPADAVLLLHPRHPWTRLQGLLSAQGNALAPLFHHPLYFDEPQVHNNGLPDLPQRLDLATAVWEGTGYPYPGTTPELIRPAAALQAIRTGACADRPLAVFTLDAHTFSMEALREAGGEQVASASGQSLWLLPPLPAADAPAAR